MKNPNNEAQTRTIIVGSVVEEKNDMQVVTSTAWEGNKFVPNACIKQTIPHGEQTIFLLEDAQVNSVSVRVADNYNYDTGGDAVLQDTADMWIEFGEVAEAPAEAPAEEG